jgi:two-component system, NtrC family, sensor kinase
MAAPGSLVVGASWRIHCAPVKLTAKFLLAYVLTTLVVLAGSGWLRVRREIQHFDVDMRQDAAAYATAVARAVAEVADVATPGKAALLVRHAADAARHLSVRWVSLEAHAGLDTPLAPATALAALERGQTVFWTRPGGRKLAALVTYQPLDREPPGLGRTAIEVTESLDVRDRFVRGTVQSTAATMAITFGCMTAVAFLLGLALVGRPLRAVGLKVRRIGAGDLSSPLVLEQRDEIGEVARELNAMCEQLAEGRRKLEVETGARIAALEQLRHADRLVTVGRLASGIAHEIGTPLAVIAGRSKMIVAGESTGAETVDNARIVVEQTQHITTIIRQLLDFARRRPAHRDRVDLVSLARKTVALLDPMAGKRGVSITVHAPTPDLLYAELDAGQIGQAVTNLLMNAIQATATGGKIDVTITRGRARPPSDHGGDEGAFISLAVADTGSGMDADVVLHVFEPFFTTKDVGEGTGLGLPVAYGLVRDHGGWIDVRSDPGKGSRFTIYLPGTMENAA